MLTLTYRDGELEPVGNFTLNGKTYPQYELNPDHWKKYIDNVRSTYRYKYGKQPTFVHFACGEYGGKTTRPHLHLLLLFNDTNIWHIAKDCWKYGNVYYRMKTGEPYTRLNEHSTDSWKITQYITKYIAKDEAYYNTESYEIVKDLEPPFLRFSRNIGLNYLAYNKQIPKAIEYLNKNIRHTMQWYNAWTAIDTYVHIDPLTLQLRTYELPKYYKNKIYQTKGLRTSCILDATAHKVSRITGEVVKVGFSKKAHQVDRPNFMGYAHTRYLSHLSNLRESAELRQYGEGKEAFRQMEASRIADLEVRQERAYKRAMETHRNDRF